MYELETPSYISILNNTEFLTTLSGISWLARYRHAAPPSISVPLDILPAPGGCPPHRRLWVIHTHARLQPVPADDLNLVPHLKFEYFLFTCQHTEGASVLVSRGVGEEGCWPPFFTYTHSAKSRHVDLAVASAKDLFVAGITPGARVSIFSCKCGGWEKLTRYY